MHWEAEDTADDEFVCVLDCGMHLEQLVGSRICPSLLCFAKSKDFWGQICCHDFKADVLQDVAYPIRFCEVEYHWRSCVFGEVLGGFQGSFVVLYFVEFNFVHGVLIIVPEIILLIEWNSRQFDEHGKRRGSETTSRTSAHKCEQRQTQRGNQRQRIQQRCWRWQPEWQHAATKSSWWRESSAAILFSKIRGREA